jgi:pimeloyl-ACP methyl ester carboxylesterase
MTGSTEQTTQLDGATLAIHCEGEGPPTLLIQGVGVAGCGWGPQVEQLREHHRCCSFDNRGIGQSTGKPSTIEAMAHDALAVLDHLGWDQAHIVGHSMGGVIATQLALLAPDRVRSLSLLCTLSRGSRVIRFDVPTLWRQTLCQVGTRAMRRRAFFRLVSPRALWPAAEADVLALERVFQRPLDQLPKVALAQVAAMRRHDVFENLGPLAQLPTLVASAQEDIVCPPSEGRELAAALGVDLVLVPGAHAVTVQDADRINALLLEFLAAH